MVKHRLLQPYWLGPGLRERNVDMRSIKCFFLVLTGFLLSCSDDEGQLDIFTLTYDFNSDEGSWTPGFTDYPIPETPEDTEIYDWAYYYGDTAKASNGRKVVMLTCNNVNGDVFMFLKKKVEGLKPNTRYNLIFDISVATNAISGEGVILKVGGSDLEPKTIIENNYYTLNLDKGNSLNSGESLISLGDCGAITTAYEYLEKNNGAYLYPLLAMTNSKGELWLIVGTDSLREGYNVVLYSRINVVFSVSE